MSKHLVYELGMKGKKIPTNFLVNHISSSFVGMVQWWLDNKLEQTPEELSDYFMAVIEPILVSE